MKKLTCRSWGVSNTYKVKKLNQLIRGWINYFKIGSMKKLCRKLDKHIRFRLRMCIWKHWKTPKNREKNLIKLGLPRRAAHGISCIEQSPNDCYQWDFAQYFNLFYYEMAEKRKLCRKRWARIAFYHAKRDNWHGKRFISMAYLSCPSAAHRHL